MTKSFIIDEYRIQPPAWSCERRAKENLMNRSESSSTSDDVEFVSLCVRREWNWTESWNFFGRLSACATECFSPADVRRLFIVFFASSFYLFVNCFLISWIPTQVSWHVKRFERVIRLHPKWLSHHFSIAQSFQISIYDFTQSFAPFNLHTSSLSFEQQHWSWWWKPSGGSSDHKLVSRSSNFNYHSLNEAQSFTSQLKQMQARKFRTRIKLRSTINHRELKKLALKFVNF